MTTPTRRLRPAVALLLAVLASLWTSVAPASAHAVLVDIHPPDGAIVAAAPAQVSLRFNEPVAATEAAVRVFDAQGTRIDGGLLADGADGEVAVRLPGDLPDGGYVVTYRVVSRDSHPIAGTTTFAVGEGAAVDPALVEELAGPGAGPVGVLGSLLRGIGYLGTLLAAGAVAFAVGIARSDADRARSRTVARRSAVVAIVAGIVHVPLQTVAVTGYGFVEAVTSAALLDTVASSFGQSVAVRLLGLALLVLLWVRRPRSPLLGIAAAIAVGSYLLDGHQRTVEPTWLLVAGDAVHLAAAAVWAGGLLLLALTLRTHRLEDDPVGAATLVARFSRVALWSVLVLAAAGAAMSLVLVGTPTALVSTTYGGLLLAKVGLVLLAVAIAWHNRTRLVPAVAASTVPAGGSGTATPELDRPARDGAEAAWRRLRTTVGAEVALVAAAVLVTGFLATTQPAAEAVGPTDPLVLEEPLAEDLDLQLTIDPPRAGTTTLHLYVLEPGGISDRVDDLRLEFTFVTQGIGPFVVEPFAAGPGHWTATIDDLRFAGRWEARVVGGLGRFEELETTLTFDLAP